MAVTVSNDASFSSGAISFSALRSKFKNTNIGSVSLSSLIRQTSLLLESSDLTVPDATENENIPTTAEPDSNIQLSDYRGSVTYYDLIQTETNEDLDIDELSSWNSNLGKNVPKTFYVNGTIGTRSTDNYAASFDAAAFNLSINIGTNGSIQGAGGAGGTPSSPDGKDGGNALYVKSNTTSGSSATRKIKLYNTGKIYAGGGGGGCGAKGGTGGAGGSVRGLSGGAGGAGGNGGNGGNGRGYDQARTDGSDGSDGDTGVAGDTTNYYDLSRTSRTYRAGRGGTGGKGGIGGNGGNWGESGTVGKDGYVGKDGNSTDRSMAYNAKWSGTQSVEFRVSRDASFKIDLWFGGYNQGTFPATSENERIGHTLGQSQPGSNSFACNNGTYYEDRNVVGGIYAPVHAADRQIRGLKGIRILNRYGGATFSVDDAGRDDGFDYTDIEVKPNRGFLYNDYSASGSAGGSQLNNHGSGGSAGKRITGSNYIII
jgi:hypothetical protein